MPPSVVLEGAEVAAEPGAPTPGNVMSLRITSAPKRPIWRPSRNVPMSLLANVQAGGSEGRVGRAAVCLQVRAAAVVGGDARIEAKVHADVEAVLRGLHTKDDGCRQQAVTDVGDTGVAVGCPPAREAPADGYRVFLAVRINVVDVNVAVDRKGPVAVGARQVHRPGGHR